MVVFQFSSFLPNLETQVAIRTGTSCDMSAVLSGIFNSAPEDKKASGRRPAIRNLGQIVSKLAPHATEAKPSLWEVQIGSSLVHAERDGR